MMGRWGAVIVLLLLALPVHADISDASAEALSRLYTHTAWTAKDGAPSGISAISQGVDGWLWFGSPSGLYRFDGKTFERRDPFPADDVTSRSVVGMYAAPSGNRWVAFASGRVAMFRRGEDKPAKIITMPGGRRPDSFLEDGAGRVFALDDSAIFMLRGDAFVPLDDSWQFGHAEVVDATVDYQGNIWVTTTQGMLELKKGATQFVVDAHAEYANGSIAVAGDGRLWHNGEATGIGFVPGSAPHPAPPVANDSFHIIDRYGAFWRVGCPTGVCRVPHPETYGSPDKFNDAVINALYTEGMS